MRYRSGVSRSVALLSIVLGCGSKPPAASWIEQDTLGGSHASPVAEENETPISAETAAVAATIDLGKLDAAKIDALDEPTVLALLERAGDAAPAARLALRAARLAHHRGDGAIARARIARAAAAADEPSVHGELGKLAAELATPAVDAKTIAVLLPLTGRFSPIGNELRAAIQLAPPNGTKWLFLDTRGEPAGAVAAVEMAVTKGAIGILGPVGEREAVAAARVAALRRIPIALLAPADGADPAAGVFRMIDSPGDEARFVARIALEDNFPTVAVFSPRDDIGAETADAFVAEAKRLGLSVNHQGTYDPTGGNLEPDVKAFLNLVPAQNPRLAEHLGRHGKKGWSTFSPDVNYSLLYIPDRYDRAALVAAFLPYFNVELRTTEFPDQAMLKRKHGGHVPQVVQLVGGAGWHHPTLPVRGGTPIQGALIVDTFLGELGADAGAQFAAAFSQRTKRTPSSAAAQAHDAALVIANARREAASSSDPRAALRAALSRAKLDDGACGPATMAADGELAREPIVLEVQGDQFLVAP
jgi:branched-chain amino acid transport system substrate-binding protein